MKNGIKHVINFSIPDSSDEFAPNFYLDDVYDGNLNKENKRLEGGLGVLSDGLFGGRVIISDQGINPGTLSKFSFFKLENEIAILLYWYIK